MKMAEVRPGNRVRAGREGQSMAGRRLRLFMSAILLLVAACSDVRVMKVPTPTQYDHWDDERQACADGMEGFRFYMPRPCVAVNQAFPITARSYVLDGKISPDRTNVVITPPENETLCGILKTCMRCTKADGGAKPGTGGGPESAAEKSFVFPYSVVRTRNLRPGGPEAEPEKKPGPGNEELTPPNFIVPPAPGTVGRAKIGFRATNDPYPMTLLRKYFDIINLPDFDEQFVVKRIDGLGSTTSDLVVGQGQVLQGFNADVNNEALATLTLGLIQTGAQALTATALGGLSLPALPAGGSALVPGTAKGGPESVGEPLGDVKYEPVSLIVTVAYFATPGVYPIMKPREVRDWKRVGAFSLGYAGSLACPCADGGLNVRLGPYGIPYQTFQYVLVEKVLGGPTGYQVISAPGEEQKPTLTEAELKTEFLRILGSSEFDITIDGTRAVVTVKDGATVVPVETEQKRVSLHTSLLASANKAHFPITEVALPLSLDQYVLGLKEMNDALAEASPTWTVVLGEHKEPGGVVSVSVKRVNSEVTGPPNAAERLVVEEAALRAWRNFIGLITPPGAANIAFHWPE